MKSSISIWNHKTAIVYEYRCDPVPRVRCARGASYGKLYLKRPRTMQERRAYFHDEVEEYNIRLRDRRSARQLPNAWDDYPRGDVGIKNWKSYRKTQWKG